MEGTVRKAALTLMSEQCYKEFFVNLNFFHTVCLKALISKLLGIVIIAGSSIVKVPQILKIYSNQSAEGVSFINVLADLYGITVSSAYSFIKGFPLSAYGEGIMMGLQTGIIAAQVLHHSVSSIVAAGFVGVYAVLCYYAFGGFVPVDILWNLQATVLPIILLGKMAQAFANYKNQSTGQLSVVTCGMLLFGSLSRVFTSIQETGDRLFILTYILASLGNAIIVFQFIYYRKSSSAPQKSKKKSGGKKKQQ